MQKILEITKKDLLQLVRDRKIFLFLLIMPLAFTLLFGFTSGGMSRGVDDSRLPVGFLDFDQSWLSKEYSDLLQKSSVIRLSPFPNSTPEELGQLVAEGELAGAIILPAGYGKALVTDKNVQVLLIADETQSAGSSVKSEVLTAAQRIDNAVRIAVILEQEAGEKAPFDYAFRQALKAWEQPPIQVTETTSSVLPEKGSSSAALVQLSPGIMLQFAIASLLTSAQVMVSERKSKALSRLLTTAIRRTDIILGHYLTIIFFVFGQFITLIIFGQTILRVDYLRSPGATLLVTFSAALAISALGLLIGVFTKSQEQAIAFSLILMFVMAGLGGAWVPLEITGAAFQTIGHLTPVAWAMDGFKNIIVRGWGIQGVLLPSGVLLAYAVLFFSLASWRFQSSQEA